MSDSKFGPFSTALFESVLIVLSILLALWLDQRQDDSESLELVDRSISNFINELTRNRARVEDISIYHQAVGQILENRNNDEVTTTIVEFRNIMDSMQSVVLTSSAWETAVATGALGRMDYSLVSALSLTYNTQLRFDANYNSTLQSLLSPNNMTEQNLDVTVYNASRFVADISNSESQLSAYYAQTLELLAEY